MFEREIKFIYDFNLNKVTKLGPYFTFEQLLSTDLHPAILHYISAEIDFLIFEDRQRLLKNSIFDYSGEKITHHFALISEEVKRSKRLSQEYISKLILHATSFTINFLVRPNWTLLKFIYDEGDHKTTTEIKQILNYLYYYKFLKKVIIKYINTKKILSMNSKEFLELLLKVDKLGLESNLGGVLSNSLKSMAEFFNIGELLKSKIPFLAVEMYLEEKQLKGHLEKLRAVFDEDKTSKYNISEYQKIFGGLIFQKEEVVIDQQIEEELEPDTKTQEPVESFDQFDNKVNTKFEDENGIAEVETPNLIEGVPDNGVEFDNYREIDSAVEDEADSGPGLFDNVFNKQQDEIEIDSDKLNEDQEVLESQNESGDDSEIFKEPEQKKSPFKFKFRFGKNNKLEKIQEEETEQPEISGEELKKQIAQKIGSEEENAFEKPVEDVLNIENQLNEMNKNTELDSNDDELNKLLDKADDYSDVLEDESTKVNEETKDEEENVDESMILDEDENESMLKSILSESKDSDDQDEFISSQPNQISDEKPNVSKVELAELLERKEMTKIIEVLFDYDIEEFSNTLEQIVACDNLDEANKILNSTLKKNKVSRRSKEAETFRQIISEFFNRD